MSSPDSGQVKNSYFIDIESGAETARLIEQDRLMTEAMGGIFPEQPDLTDVAKVLDLACGPGGWALEVAFQHQDMDVLGVDLNETMVKYARALAKVQQLRNVQFEVMDVKQPLTFEDNSFDLVNARLIASFMDRTSWLALIAECKRILRPGGILRLSELEFTVSSSAALQRFTSALYQALSRQGRTFSVDGRSEGIIHMLSKLLRDAGFEEIGNRAFHLDASYGMPMNYSACKDAEVAIALLKPFLLRAGTINEAEYDDLYNQLLAEMASTEFTCINLGMTTWGKKPA